MDNPLLQPALPFFLYLPLMLHQGRQKRLLSGPGRRLNALYRPLPLHLCPLGRIQRQLSSFQPLPEAPFTLPPGGLPLRL